MLPTGSGIPKRKQAGPGALRAYVHYRLGLLPKCLVI